MSLPKSSVSTADLVAAWRAWHQRQPKPIFRDPYARFLCGRFLGFAALFPPLGRLLVRVFLRRIEPVGMEVVMRARFAEDQLEEAVAGGIGQFLIVGAGMDSFAFRRPDLAGRIQVFEIDHPLTQAKKLERIRKAGLAVPEPYHFVAADLTEVSPTEALADTPFDPSEPAFVSLLGVVFYLTPEVLSEAMRSLSAGVAPGTRIVLDYLLDEESTDPGWIETRDRLLAFVAGRGEPMRASYSLDTMESLMAAEGYQAVRNFPFTDLEESYAEAFGPLQSPIPGMFGFGVFEVAPCHG